MLSLTVIGELRQEEIPGAGVLLKRGEANGMICGMVSTTHQNLHFIDQVMGKKKGFNVQAASNALVLPGRQVFLVDTHVNVHPTAGELAEITIMAVGEVRRFGIEPKIALSAGATRRPRRDAAVAVVAQAVWDMARRLCADHRRAAIAIVAIAMLSVLTTIYAQLIVIGLGTVLGFACCQTTLSTNAMDAQQDAHEFRVCRVVGGIALNAFLRLALWASGSSRT